MDPKEKRIMIVTCKVGEKTDDTLEYITAHSGLNRSQAVRVGLELLVRALKNDELVNAGKMEGGREEV